MSTGAAAPDGRERIGGYALGTVLAQGSTATIYEAYGADPKPIALKVSRSVREPHLRAMNREVTTLARIRHPGIIPILAHGIEGTKHWLAMPLVTAPSLRRWASVARDEHAFVTSALTVAAALARTLAFLHGEGLVHGDLTPDNVLVPDEAAPLLLDFGLSTHFAGGTNREPVDEVEVAGTAAYMAPEVISKSVVDGRADLYSLGCILHELLTGHPPFDGTVRAVLRAHLDHPPSPPSERAPAVPKDLDALVLRLLAKDPTSRPAYADDVVRALVRLGGRPPSHAEWRPRPHFCRPGLVGREETIRQLGVSLDALEKGEGGVTVLSGPSGIGKSRLALEIVRAASRRGLRVLTGSSAGMSGHSFGRPAATPLESMIGPLATIAMRVREWGVDESRRLLGGRARVLGAVLPEFGDLADDAEPLPPPLLPEAARQRLLAALSETLAAMADANPLLLVLDDLQWADDVTVAWVEQVARTQRFARVPIRILGAARRDEADPRIDRLLGTPGLDQVPLSRLDTSVIPTMAAMMLGASDSPPALVSSLARASRGNPFFVAEYLRAALEAGTLRRSDEGRWEVRSGGVLPEGQVPIAELVSRRLKTLSEEARAGAGGVAVLSGQVAEPLIAKTGSFDASVLGRGLDELRTRSVLELASEGWRFEHDNLREQVYALIGPESRGRLHKAAAVAMERELETEERAPLRARLSGQIGIHYMEAAEHASAFPHLQAAAQAASASYANHEAARLLRAALVAAAHRGVSDSIRAGLERELGTALNAVGLIDESREHHERALQLLGSPFPRSRAALAGRTLVSLAKGFFKNPRRDATEEGLRRIADIYGSTEGLCFLLSDNLALVHTATRLRELGARSGSPALMARGNATFGAMLGLVPLHGLADRMLRRSQELAAISEDPSSCAWVGMVEAYYRCGMAEWERATHMAKWGLEFATRCGELRRREECLSILCEIESMRGDPASAISLADEGYASALSRGDTQTQLWALCDKARMLLALGAPEQALAVCSAATEVLQETMLADRTMVAGIVALASSRVGRASDAHEKLREAVEIGERADPGVYHAVHGCMGAAQAGLSLAAGSKESSDDTLGWVERAIAVLRRFGPSFAASRPRYWLYSGQLALARGTPRKADKHLRRALALAEQLDMRLDAVEARAGLARLALPVIDTADG